MFKDTMDEVQSTTGHTNISKATYHSPRRLLGCWAPITTRLLEGTAANCRSWYALDNVMGDSDNFVSNLRQELEENGILQSLKAAKTTGERQTNDILSLLQQNGMLGETSSSAESSSSVRGDKSAFLGRNLRQRKLFPTKFPCLHSLLQRFEDTAQHYLGHCLEFDFRLTSIQVAEFPGNGISGYTRHCDRSGDLCRQENTLIQKVESRERLITGVYYLTPDDWDQKLDGGCLRIFGEDHDHPYSYIDVAPYSNRMIVFRSDGVEHEVRPSLRRPRMALTIWLYGRIKNDTGDRVPLESKECVSMSAMQPKENLNNQPIAQAQAGPPPLPVDLHITADNHPTSRKHPTIFVSIAAYRDSETGPTIRNLSATAAYSNRVFVGLVLQLDADHDDAIYQALPTEDPWYRSNVRCLQMEARQAVGPCYARALCQSLFRGEDYVLQIDSHMRFRKNWDEYLIQQLEALPANKQMLTAYPVGYHLPNKVPNEVRGTMLLPWKFGPDGMLRQRGKLFEKSLKPIPCYLYAAGFNFSRSSVMQDCPYDESLHHLFFGEELSMAVRLFTKGYDLFAPSESICYHLWSRDHRPIQSAAMNSAEIRDKDRRRQQSIEHVKQQLLGQAEFSRHGLGNARTARAFAEALGVDFTQGTLQEGERALQGLEFADDSSNFAPSSLEAKVQTLDAGTKNLIAAFLHQVTKNED